MVGGIETSESYSYNEIFGGLTTVGEFEIIDFGSGEYSIGTSDLILRKQININGLQVETLMEMYGYVIFDEFCSFIR